LTPSQNSRPAPENGAGFFVYKTIGQSSFKSPGRFRRISWQLLIARNGLTRRANHRHNVIIAKS
jgi:hypothetical protein